MANPIVHWEIGGRDAAKLEQFYGGMFDWSIKVHEEVEGYRMVETGEGGVGGGLMQTEGDMPPNYLTFYIEVDDLQASLDKAVDLGGQAPMPPTHIPGIGDDVTGCDQVILADEETRGRAELLALGGVGFHDGD